jgi:hypothetical protein
MSDWKSFCESFNSKQAFEKRFPNQCDTNTSRKSLSEIFSLFTNILEYDTNLQAITPLRLSAMTDASGAKLLEDFNATLKNNVYSFCCAVDERYSLNNTLKDAKENYEVANGRVKSVRDPAAGISDRGTSFPFGRPLKVDSVPILLMVTISFLILSLGMLLQLGNIQISYTGPLSVGPSFFEMLYESYQTTNKWFILIIALGAGGIAAGIFYAIQKTHPEVFGLKSSEQIS